MDKTYLRLRFPTDTKHALSLLHSFHDAADLRIVELLVGESGMVSVGSYQGGHLLQASIGVL